MSAVLKYFSSQALPYHQDKKRHGREEAQARVAYSSRCIYVGNLAFVTTDVQLYTLFSQCGSIERVVMGINRNTKQPAGFAYVIFVQRESAMDAVNNLHGTLIDEKILKVEIDKGYHEGKEFGRGSTGAQVRDEHRTNYDELRGGILNTTGTTTMNSGSSSQYNNANHRGGYVSRKFNSNNNNNSNNYSNTNRYNNNNRYNNHNNRYNNNNYNNNNHRSSRYPTDTLSSSSSSSTTMIGTSHAPSNEEKQYTSRDDNHTSNLRLTSGDDDYLAQRGEKRGREDDDE